MLLLKWPPHIKNNGRAMRYARAVRELEWERRLRVGRSLCLFYPCLENKSDSDEVIILLYCLVMIGKMEEEGIILVQVRSIS